MQRDPVGDGVPRLLPTRQGATHEREQKQPGIRLPRAWRESGMSLGIYKCGMLMLVHRAHSSCVEPLEELYPVDYDFDRALAGSLLQHQRRCTQ